MALLIHARLARQSPEELVYDVEDGGAASQVLIPFTDYGNTRERNPGNEFVAERVASRVASMHRRTGSIPTSFSIVS